MANQIFIRLDSPFRIRVRTTQEKSLNSGVRNALVEVSRSKVANRSKVILQRKPSSLWINQYNPDSLTSNRSQPIVMCYYSIFISEAERAIGLLLGQAHKEASLGNTSAKVAMRKLGVLTSLTEKSLCMEPLAFNPMLL